MKETLRHETYAELFARAADEEYGIIIESTNSRSMIQILTSFKVANGLTGFTLCQSSEPNLIFLMKSSAELP
jgi:hypothetical protein